jgi:predicted transcriptional regulator YheO
MGPASDKSSAASKARASRLLRNYEFTPSDHQFLKSLEPLMEGIARSLGPHSEIVLHSLGDLAHSVVQIKNGYVTGREVGAPITNLALKVLAEALETRQDVIGPYLSTTDQGRTVKSVTTLLRNRGGHPVGFFCINVDLDVSLLEFVRGFADLQDGSGPQAAGPEIYPLELPDLIRRSLADELPAIAGRTGVSASEKNRLLVLALEQKHIFSIKGAVELVAREMGVSRHTIYNNLRSLRRGQAPDRSAGRTAG